MKRERGTRHLSKGFVASTVDGHNLDARFVRSCENLENLNSEEQWHLFCEILGTLNPEPYFRTLLNTKCVFLDECGGTVYYLKWPTSESIELSKIGCVNCQSFYFPDKNDEFGEEKEDKEPYNSVFSLLPEHVQSKIIEDMLRYSNNRDQVLLNGESVWKMMDDFTVIHGEEWYYEMDLLIPEMEFVSYPDRANPVVSEVERQNYQRRTQYRQHVSLKFIHVHERGEDVFK